MMRLTRRVCPPTPRALLPTRTLTCPGATVETQWAAVITQLYRMRVPVQTCPSLCTSATYEYWLVIRGSMGDPSIAPADWAVSTGEIPVSRAVAATAVMRRPPRRGWNEVRNMVASQEGRNRVRPTLRSGRFPPVGTDPR